MLSIEIKVTLVIGMRAGVMLMIGRTCINQSLGDHIRFFSRV